MGEDGSSEESKQTVLLAGRANLGIAVAKIVAGLLAAVGIFVLGAGFSFFQGVHAMLSPEPASDSLLAYGVPAVAAVFEGSSWLKAVVQLRRDAGSERGVPHRRRDLPDGDPCAVHRLPLRERHRGRRVTGPLLFGKPIDNVAASQDITGIAFDHFLGAGLMIAGALVEAFLGVRAEGKALESIAALTAEDQGSSGDRRASPQPA